ncbi:GNAT family N-acetyltransferase [Paraburkholderia sp. NMBU_R16]|uniref:bifunctional acetate--CoA ligase family protein/GNAT family N-acetyltransferase n=1 Tax=Paraburkholderia sp. NMBU_R16 TaxID=2698676 RepID=UPI0015656BBD|nr:GNAT family N-acetyltransferase [Paraburkholderia sp. NMBU_R16]
MTVRNLEAVFNPQSVVIVGAFDEPGSIATVAWTRLVQGGFKGPMWPLDPRDGKDLKLSGREPAADSNGPAVSPDLAVICTRSFTWASVVQQLGEMGTRAAIILGEAHGDDSGKHLHDTLAAARPYLLRIVGPASLGVIVPAICAHLGVPTCCVPAGGVAWVSQSNALTNGVLTWAQARGLGFSHVIALGAEADVDAGDVLDYLARAPDARAILLELDTVRAARKFMSAARAAARNKPVLALRTSRHDPDDALYSYAFRRAGVVRVDALDDLLDEIETLGTGRVAVGDTATLITSDHGVATLASDAIAATGGRLACWSDAAHADASGAVPEIHVGNPVVLGEHARPEDFGAIIKTLAPHVETGTTFVVHAPTHTASADDVAQTLIAHQRYACRGLLACFFGGVDAATREALHAHGIPVHSTPSRLASAFSRLVDYRLVQELLTQMPEDAPAQHAVYISKAQAQARAALAAGVTELSGDAAGQLLERFGLQVEQQRNAAQEKVANAFLVSVDLYDDSNFGPVFRFQSPSIDGILPPMHAYGLPPLNPILARDILSRSPYGKRIPPDATLNALTRLSQAVCEVREIVELHLILRLTPESAVIVAPRLGLGRHRSRLAIAPYPRRLEETVDLAGSRLTIRPIRPEDEAAHREFVDSMSPEDRRLRFFVPLQSIDHARLARMTQIDYDREMSLIATQPAADGTTRILGVAHVVNAADNESAEFAIAVRTDCKGQGIGRLLMTRIIEHTSSRGLLWLNGTALQENSAMIALAKSCNFAVTPTTDPSVVAFAMQLNHIKPSA